MKCKTQDIRNITSLGSVGKSLIIGNNAGEIFINGTSKSERIHDDAITDIIPIYSKDTEFSKVEFATSCRDGTIRLNSIKNSDQGLITQATVSTILKIFSHKKGIIAITESGIEMFKDLTFDNALHFPTKTTPKDITVFNDKLYYCGMTPDSASNSFLTGAKPSYGIYEFDLTTHSHAEYINHAQEITKLANLNNKLVTLGSDGVMIWKDSKSPIPIVDCGQQLIASKDKLYVLNSRNNAASVSVLSESGLKISTLPGTFDKINVAALSNGSLFFADTQLHQVYIGKDLPQLEF
jgi:hypothetical protein